MRFKAELMDEMAISRALTRITHEIIEKNRGTENLCIVGIKRRGEILAEIIQGNICKIEHAEVPCASIDIKYYRDDLSNINDSPVLHNAELPFDVTGKTLVLVDDVLFTGRTARAGMEAVITSGRPKAILLAVLVDRGHRELPIRADFIGKNVPTSNSEMIEVRIPPFDNETRVCLMEISD